MITGEYFSNLISPYAPGRIPPTPTPADLFSSGEQGGWWDVSDFTTMFRDVAGTIPVTAVGQNVERINDKSGRGNHLVSVSVGPVLRQDGGGNYYLDCIGSTSSTLWTNGAFNLGASSQLLVTFGIDKNSTSVKIIAETSTGHDSAPIVNCWALATGTPVSGCYRSGMVGSVTLNSLSALDSIDSNGVKQVVTSQFDIIAGTITARFNQAPQTLSYIGGIVPGTFFSATEPLYMFSRGNSGIAYVGKFYGGIIRGGTSSIAQVQIAENYINSKMAAF